MVEYTFEKIQQAFWREMKPKGVCLKKYEKIYFWG